jgi:hypothetical protein
MLPGTAAAQQDFLRPLDESEIPDTTSYFDSSMVIEKPDSVAEYVVEKKGPKKLKLVQRGYSYRQQIGLAVGMMAFVAVIFTTSQNWNPD